MDAYAVLLQGLAQEPHDPINRCSASILTLLTNAFTNLSHGNPTPDEFTTLLHLAHQRINALAFHAVGAEWLRLYVDATIGLVLSEIHQHRTSGRKEAEWTRWIRLLDMGIIVAGAIGPGREEMIHALVERVQRDFAADEVERFKRLAERDLALESERQTDRKGLPTIHFAPRPIPSPTTPPSPTTYTTTAHLEPFILRGFATPDDTPALKAWQSPAYLLAASGPGRYVPVEIGKSYTDQGWGQRIVKFETFLRGIGYDLSDVFPGSSDALGEEEEEQIPEGQPLYLAQHALLDQFPALRPDIGALPDYVYSAPGLYDGEEYAPPGNEEGLVMNVWVGSGASSVGHSDTEVKHPRGGPVISPAHTDPYFNCYLQILGTKRVWLAPPHVADAMYAFPEQAASAAAADDDDPETQGETQDLVTSYTTNTSRVPIFSNPDGTLGPLHEARYARFYERAWPESMEAVLQPGDLLVMPPKWWHAMRSEGGGVAWSLSMWY